MSCLREVQTITNRSHILPMPSLTRLTTGGVLAPPNNTTNTSHNELLHQDPLQPPLEPRAKMLKIAVIGAGRIGHVHAKTIAAHPGATLALVADPFGDAAQKLAEVYGVRHTTDGDSVFTDDGVDAVVIGSPSAAGDLRTSARGASLEPSTGRSRASRRWRRTQADP